MSFEKWYSRQETSVWRALLWIKDDLKDAYLAGRKSVKIPKPVTTTPIGIAAVREVIAEMRGEPLGVGLRQQRDWADKLESAIK